MRTDSTCEHEKIKKGICKYAVRTMVSDDLRINSELYVTYNCSIARPARCQMNISDRVLNFSISDAEELDRELEKRLEKRKSLQKRTMML
jgi:bacterioferritin (cytochrome b1)